jgi:hypothetical protein
MCSNRRLTHLVGEHKYSFSNNNNEMQAVTCKTYTNSLGVFDGESPRMIKWGTQVTMDGMLCWTAMDD